MAGLGHRCGHGLVAGLGHRCGHGLVAGLGLGLSRRQGSEMSSAAPGALRNQG